jgi:hypothetical protein
MERSCEEYGRFTWQLLSETERVHFFSNGEAGAVSVLLKMELRQALDRSPLYINQNCFPTQDASNSPDICLLHYELRIGNSIFTFPLLPYFHNDNTRPYPSSSRKVSAIRSLNWRVCLQHKCIPIKKKEGDIFSWNMPYSGMLRRLALCISS